MTRGHRESHKIKSIGWLRAAVLGANDGIISTASLIIGVASAHASHGNLLLTGVAGLIAGAMSMATGEYVSVSSQADTERAALAEEKAELENDGPHEHRELAAIYERRGLERGLADEVAHALMAHDALGAHARDELGITEITTAKPLQAALSSASSFAVGASLPLVVTTISPDRWTVPAIAGTSLLFLATLGGLAARAGGAPLMPGMLRVMFWSALSMGVASGIGNLLGAT
ncbi:VIT1/CCC1 transporter family protein [Caballeronia temeraria]|nr:VIT family protein [Caballeronia temeraria]